MIYNVLYFLWHFNGNASLVIIIFILLGDYNTQEKQIIFIDLNCHIKIYISGILFQNIHIFYLISRVLYYVILCYVMKAEAP